jgi:purine-binding chemotaxis protein CheW
MNLAEIRKKARQEKAAESTAPVEGRQEKSAVFSNESGIAPYCAPDNVEMPSQGPVSPSGESARESLRESVAPANGDSASFGAPGDEAAMAFDPLSVLLAGRKSAGTVADMIDRMPEAPSESGEELLKYLRFRVDDEDYGVSLLEIREIIKPRAITEVPRMPAFIAGVLSLRGTIIPVFDMRLRLGLVIGRSSGRERIIIAKRREGSCGLLVDEVFQVIGLNASAIEKAPTVLEGVDREFVKGIGRQGERMLILLDLEKIMDVSLR